MELNILYYKKLGKELYLHKIKDGFNYITEWSYKRMTETDNNFYSKGNYINYPALINIQSPINLVYEFKRQNGIGGYFTNRYSYSEAKLHLQGKGFLGIKEISNDDLTLGFKTQAIKSHSWSYQVIPYQTNTYKTSNSYLINTSTLNNEFINLGINKCWFRVNSITENKFFEGQNFSTSFIYDSYGNQTKITKNINNIETQVTEVTYGQYGTPIPAKPTLITQTSTRSGESSYSQQTKIEYNTLGQVYKKN
ncbi:MAG: hypothetical protein R2771_15655 [Saprospiraceae bacterium]